MRVYFGLGWGLGGLLVVSVMTSCTLAGALVGRAVSPRISRRTKVKVAAPEGSFNRERFLRKYSPNSGEPIWIAHDGGTKVTMGAYAGLNPDDAPRETVRRGALKLTRSINPTPGIRVETSAGTVEVPFAKIS